MYYGTQGRVVTPSRFRSYSMKGAYRVSGGYYDVKGRSSYGPALVATLAHLKVVSKLAASLAHANHQNSRGHGVKSAAVPNLDLQPAQGSRQHNTTHPRDRRTLFIIYCYLHFSTKSNLLPPPNVQPLMHGTTRGFQGPALRSPLIGKHRY